MKNANKFIRLSLCLAAAWLPGQATAASLLDIIRETLLATTSERQGRVIDSDAGASMEQKKQEGYF